jgi:hypothetical protein
VPKRPNISYHFTTKKEKNAQHGIGCECFNCRNCEYYRIEDYPIEDQQRWAAVKPYEKVDDWTTAPQVRKRPDALKSRKD